MKRRTCSCEEICLVVFVAVLGLDRTACPVLAPVNSDRQRIKGDAKSWRGKLATQPNHNHSSSTRQCSKSESRSPVDPLTSRILSRIKYCFYHGDTWYNYPIESLGVTLGQPIALRLVFTSFLCIHAGLSMLFAVELLCFLMIIPLSPLTCSNLHSGDILSYTSGASK